MNDFFVIMFLVMFGLGIVFGIVTIIWRNMGCIFIFAIVALISLVIFKAMGLHF